MITEINEVEDTSTVVHAALNVRAVLGALVTRQADVSTIFEQVTKGLSEGPAKENMATPYMVSLIGTLLDELGRIVDKHRHDRGGRREFGSEVADVGRAMIVMGLSTIYAATIQGEEARRFLTEDVNDIVRKVFRDLAANDEAIEREGQKATLHGASTEALKKFFESLGVKIEDDEIGETKGNA